MYRIYADGACQPNPGECGSGVAVYKDAKLVRLFWGITNRWRLTT